MFIDKFIDKYHKKFSYTALVYKHKQDITVLKVITAIAMSLIFLFFSGSFIYGFKASVIAILILFIWFLSFVLMFDRSAKKYNMSFFKFTSQGYPDKLLKIQIKKAHRYLKKNNLNHPEQIDVLISQLQEKSGSRKSNIALVGVISAFIIFILSTLIDHLCPSLKIDKELSISIGMAAALTIILFIAIRALYFSLMNSKKYDYKHLIKLLNEIKLIEIKERNRNRKA